MSFIQRLPSNMRSTFHNRFVAEQDDNETIEISTKNPDDVGEQVRWLFEVVKIMA